MQPDESYLLQKYNGGARRDFQKLWILNKKVIG
jgi:hypothetical protein